MLDASTSDVVPTDAGFRDLVRRSTVFLAGPVVGRMLGIVTVPFVVTALGGEAFGRLEILSTALSALASVLLLGLDVSALGLAHRTNGRSSAAFSSALVVAGVVSGFVVLVALWAQSPISRWLFDTDSERTAVAFVAVAILCTVLGLVGRGVLRSEGRAAAHSITALVTSGATAIGVVVVLVSGATVTRLTSALAFGAAAGAAVALWFARSALAVRPEPRLVPTLLRQGAPQAGSAAALWGTELGQRTLLLVVVGPLAVGQLGIGARLASIVGFVTVAIHSAWQPRVFGLLRRPGGAAIVRRDAVRMITLLVLVGLLVGGGLRPGLVLLGGEELGDRQLVAALLIVMVVGTGVTQVALVHTLVDGRFGAALRASAVGLLLGLLTSLALISRFGVEGVAVGMAVSQWVAAGMGWRSGRGHLAAVPLRQVAWPLVIGLSAILGLGLLTSPWTTALLAVLAIVIVAAPQVLAMPLVRDRRRRRSR